MSRQYGEPDLTPGKEQPRAYADRNKPEPQTKPEDPAPNIRTVTLFHRNAAVDSRPEDIHHTLGNGSNQASQGNHNHDGGNSALLLDGLKIKGKRSDPKTQMQSIVDILKRLGAEDERTA